MTYRSIIKQTARVVLLVFVFTNGVTAQKPYYPDSVWMEKQPAALQLKTEWIDSAVRFAMANEVKLDVDLRIANLKAYVREPDYKILGPTKSRGGPAGIILKNGYIVAKWGDLNRVDMTFSVTKSYLSAVAGLAFDRGLIGSVDDKLNSYVMDGKFDGDHNRKITWRHLLTQSSDWSGTLHGISDWADRPPREGGVDDWKNRKLNEPGTVFKYNDVRVNLAAYALMQVWRKPLPVVLKENIMDVIGASTTWRWYGYPDAFENVDGLMMQSVSGGGHHGGGVFINTYDQARFGLLFARKGKWQQKQLISEKWIRDSRVSSAVNPSYGFMWWTNAENNISSGSKDIYSAQGFGGNFIVVDEEHDLVIITRWLEPSRLKTMTDLVLKAL